MFIEKPFLKSMIKKFLNGGENPYKIEQPQKVGSNETTKIKTFKAEVIDDPQNSKNVFVNVTIEPEKVESCRPLIFGKSAVFTQDQFLTVPYYLQIEYDKTRKAF